MDSKKMIKMVKKELKMYVDLKNQIKELRDSIEDGNLPVGSDSRLNKAEVGAAETLMILLTDCICECEASLDDLMGGE